MSVRMVILGLLRNEGLYGYELKHIIEEHMGDWTKIPVGSIYFALGKLADEGKIRAASVERDGGRPEKTIYKITESGEAEFHELLRGCLGSGEKEYHEIDQGIAFMSVLEKAEALELFAIRIASLEKSLGVLRAHKTEQLVRSEVPSTAEAIFSHSLLHLEAELAWSREVLAGLESGTLTKK
jgi:DNA-binding PadR family transcriptional regulator